MLVYSLQVGAPAVAKPVTQAKPPEPKKRSRLVPLVAGIVALIVIVGWSMVFPRRKPTTAPSSRPRQRRPRPRISPSSCCRSRTSRAILRQDYFADGVTENLTTDLARIRDSFVIARNTAFTFKGKAVDAKEIGQDLGVRYVLEGSVQRDQGRVRVNAQLIDAQSGAHIWADRFEEDVADLFKLQDEVVARLANSLGNELVKAEARGDRRIANLDAFDLTMRGRALNFEFLRRPTRENNNAARALFEQALAINPEDAGALAGDARTYMIDKIYDWTSTDVDYDAKIVGQADRSIAIDPNDPRSLLYKKPLPFGRAEIIRTEGRRAADAGLALNPGSALLNFASGVGKNQAGTFAEAKSDILHAIQLSPRDPNLGLWQTHWPHPT